MVEEVPGYCFKEHVDALGCGRPGGSDSVLPILHCHLGMMWQVFHTASWATRRRVGIEALIVAAAPRMLSATATAEAVKPRNSSNAFSEWEFCGPELLQ